MNDAPENDPAAEPDVPTTITTVAEPAIEHPAPVADVPVAVAAPPASPAQIAANDGLRLRFQEIKMFLQGFEHRVDDDLSEIVDFLRNKL